MASEDVVVLDDKEEVNVDHEEKEKIQLQGKKLPFQKLRRYDSLDLESAKLNGRPPHGSKVFLISQITDLTYPSHIFYLDFWKNIFNLNFSIFYRF